MYPFFYISPGKVIEKNMYYMENNPAVVNDDGLDDQPVLVVKGRPVAKE